MGPNSLLGDPSNELPALHWDLQAGHRASVSQAIFLLLLGTSAAHEERERVAPPDSFHTFLKNQDGKIRTLNNIDGSFRLCLFICYLPYSCRSVGLMLPPSAESGMIEDHH